MAGKVCNRAHLRFCGGKWYFQYQHYGFPGVTSDTENKYAFLFVAGKGANKAVPEGYTCPPPSLLPAPLHTGDWGDTSNSPLASDPRAWKSQVTLSSPHVPHQEHWCLGKGSVSAWRRAGRGGCGEEHSQVVFVRGSAQPCSARWAHGLPSSSTPGRISIPTAQLSVKPAYGKKSPR